MSPPPPPHFTIANTQYADAMRLRLVDDDDNDVQPGQPGEALLKGPMITRGYHNNPEANKNSFTSDGWFRTGDIIRMKNDLLYIVDRKKVAAPPSFLPVLIFFGSAARIGARARLTLTPPQELIKYKGLQVAPAELEGVLVAHPSITDAAVVGVPFRGTEAPRAYVVLAPQARGSLSEADVVAYVKSQVASHKQLRGGVRLVDAVPRSPSGKILRKDLRERVRRETQTSRL